MQHIHKQWKHVLLISNAANPNAWILICRESLDSARIIFFLLITKILVNTKQWIFLYLNTRHTEQNVWIFICLGDIFLLFLQRKSFMHSLYVHVYFDFNSTTQQKKKIAWKELDRSPFNLRYSVKLGKKKKLHSLFKLWK